MRRVSAGLVVYVMGVAGCASMQEGTKQPAKKEGRDDLKHGEKKPGPVSDLSYPESFDRGLARFLSLGLNATEGIGRDMQQDGLI